MYWSGCITIITKTSISGELALLCRCSKNSMVKLSNIKITLKKGRHIQTTHTPMELVFYAMVWFILLTNFVLLSTIWCYLCCHVTQQLHNAMQLITPGLAEIWYSFWITSSLIIYQYDVCAQHHNKNHIGVKK